MGIFSDLLRVDKIPVACFDIEQCQMYEHGYPREFCSKVDGDGEIWKHLLVQIQLYSCDEIDIVKHLLQLTCMTFMQI